MTRQNGKAGELFTSQLLKLQFNMSSFRIIPNSKIDKAKYDSCIAADPASTPFLASWYLDSTAEVWLIITDENYDTVFPFSLKKKYGIQYIYQPYFNRATGIFGKDKAALRASIQNGLLNSYLFWDFYSEISFPNAGIAQSERVYQALLLDKSYELIYNEYSTKLRRNLRLAVNDKVNVIEAEDYSDFVTAFRKQTGDRIMVFRDQEYVSLNTLLNNSMKQKGTFYLEAWHNNEKTAGALFTAINNKILYIEGYSTNEGRKLRSMHLIFDFVIRKHAGSGKMLDFGGSNIDSIARFFHSFGAKDQAYFHIYRNNLPRLLRWMKKHH
jgi:hypothetical protein